MSEPHAQHFHSRGNLEQTLEFLKRTRWELRSLRRVRVYRHSLQIYDVNGDFFEIQGVGYEDEDIAPVLRAINTAFDPLAIHEPTPGEFKEFTTGRRHAWAEDRVM